MLNNCDPSEGDSKEPCSSCPVAAGQFYVQAGTEIHERVEACRIATRHARRRERIVDPREDAARIHVMRSGWAYSYSQFPDGRRQIYDFFLPGDVIDPDPPAGRALQPEVRTLTPAQVCVFDRSAATDCVCQVAALRLEAWRLMARRHRRSMRRILGAAALNAEEAVAALILELGHRMARQSGRQDMDMEFPLRLADIADCLGITEVHAGRVMRALDRREILTRRPGKRLEFNIATLRAKAGPYGGEGLEVPD